MNTTQEQVWFVTGASKGFGLSLIKQLLAGGHKVAATSRKKESIEKEVGDNPNLLALTVDLTSDDEVKKAIEETVATFGRIDVAVNNAGYMLLGALEEVSAEEFQQSMSLNVFAFENVIRNTMPYFRKQKSGHFFNFASSAGYAADACAGSYNTVKGAVISLSQALALEGKPFNIKVTIVAPGLFRTNFLGEFPVAQNKIEGYATQHLVDAMEHYNGQQPGDPDKLVKVLIDLAGKEDAPLHLVMGKDAYQRATNYYKSQLAQLEKYQGLSASTDIE